MQKENMTVGQWCDHWFTTNRHKWNGNTEGGYRNLIYSHILPGIGNTRGQFRVEEVMLYCFFCGAYGYLRRVLLYSCPFF